MSNNNVSVRNYVARLERIYQLNAESPVSLKQKLTKLISGEAAIKLCLVPVVHAIHGVPYDVGYDGVREVIDEFR